MRKIYLLIATLMVGAASFAQTDTTGTNTNKTDTKDDADTIKVGNLQIKVSFCNIPSLHNYPEVYVRSFAGSKV